MYMGKQGQERAKPHCRTAVGDFWFLSLGPLCTGTLLLLVSSVFRLAFTPLTTANFLECSLFEFLGKNNNVLL